MSEAADTTIQATITMSQPNLELHSSHRSSGNQTSASHGIHSSCRGLLGRTGYSSPSPRESPTPCNGTPQVTNFVSGDVLGCLSQGSALGLVVEATIRSRLLAGLLLSSPIQFCPSPQACIGRWRYLLSRCHRFMASPGVTDSCAMLHGTYTTVLVGRAHGERAMRIGPLVYKEGYFAVNVVSMILK